MIGRHLSNATTLIYKPRVRIILTFYSSEIIKENVMKSIIVIRTNFIGSHLHERAFFFTLLFDDADRIENTEIYQVSGVS
jgi:hypothetical protein